MPETILVVEDEPSLQETLAYNLTKQGYQVESAADGRLALDTARRLKPDLILLDIMLPGLNGVDVCKTLRRENFQAPIIMLTARGEETDKLIGLELGAASMAFTVFDLTVTTRARYRF